jgi:hypothetical protein
MMRAGGSAGWVYGGFSGGEGVWCVFLWVCVNESISPRRRDRVPLYRAHCRLYRCGQVMLQARVQAMMGQKLC